MKVVRVAGATTIAIAMLFVASDRLSPASTSLTAVHPETLPPSILLQHWTPQVGDVVFRASADLIGEAVRQRSGRAGRFSHVGVVVATPTGELMVIDDSPFGTGHAALHGIAAFVDEPTTSAVLVMRPRDAVDAAAVNAVAVDLVRRQVPFDFAFDADDRSALYCSELAFDVLRAAGVRWTGVRRTALTIPLIGDRAVITPDALARSPALRPVASWSGGDPA